MDPFAVLASGVRFDRRAALPAKRPAPQHERAHAIAPPLPELVTSPAASGGGQQPKRKKRRKQEQQQQQQQQAGQHHHAAEVSISMFGGSVQQQQQQQQAAATAATAAAAAKQPPQDALPQLQHSNDPYEEANLIRKALRIKVKGSDAPHPLKFWTDLQKAPSERRSKQQQQQQQQGKATKAGSSSKQQQQEQEQQQQQQEQQQEQGEEEGLAVCGRRLLARLEPNGWGTPTPIQRQAIPALLGRREILAVAPTGSGKTLAFLLPMLALLSQAKQRGGPAWPCGPKALLLSPTHELAGQTARVLKLLLPGSGLRCCLLNKTSAGASDFSAVDVLVANPLRLKCLVAEGKMDLTQVSYLVLDEADKLLAMGFTEQVDAILAAASNPHITRAFFSATLPDKVEALARSVLRDPLHITVGERNTAQSLVSQRLTFVGRGDSGKLLALRQLLSGSSGTISGGGGAAASGAAGGSSSSGSGSGLLPPILVFVSSKERAKMLHRELLYDGTRVDSISGDQPNSVRTAAVDNFRAGRTWVLIATDLIGRGMDFAGVNSVINYDCPATTADYIHRIGRTGRAGHAGQAITFFSEEDAPKLRGIAHLAAQAGSEVPEWMLHLTKQRDRKRARTQKRIRAAQQQAGQQQQAKKRRVGLLDGDSDDEHAAPAAAGRRTQRKQGGSRPEGGADKKQHRKGDKQQQQQQRGGRKGSGAAPGSGKKRKQQS